MSAATHLNPCGSRGYLLRQWPDISHKFSLQYPARLSHFNINQRVLKYLCYGFINSLSTTMEAPKNIKDDKEEKEIPELKEELTEDEIKCVDGGSF